MKIKILFASVSLFIVACSESEPTFDKTYYKTHESERLEKIEWCKEDVTREDTPNCRNAAAAHSEAFFDKFTGEGIPRKKIH